MCNLKELTHAVQLSNRGRYWETIAAFNSEQMAKDYAIDYCRLSGVDLRVIPVGMIKPIGA